MSKCDKRFMFKKQDRMIKGQNGYYSLRHYCVIDGLICLRLGLDEFIEAGFKLKRVDIFLSGEYRNASGIY